MAANTLNNPSSPLQPHRILRGLDRIMPTNTSAVQAAPPPTPSPPHTPPPTLPNMSEDIDKTMKDNSYYIALVFSVLCIFISSVLSIYWSYKFSFDIDKMRAIHQSCGSGLMEEETFRNQLYYYSLSIIPFEYRYKRAIYALSAFGLFSTLVAVANNSDPENAGYLGLLLIISMLLIANVARLKPSLDKKYSKEYNRVLRGLYVIMNKTIPNTNHHFIEKGLRNTDVEDGNNRKSIALSYLFTNAFIARWKAKHRNETYIDQYNDVIMTDSGNIKDIENALFNMKDGYIIGMKDYEAIEIFLRMLRSETVVFKDGDQIFRKKDLDFIYEAYHSWACNNKDLETECEKLPSKYPQLPALTEDGIYERINKEAFAFKLISLITMLLLFYIPFHYLYPYSTFIQIVVLIFVMILLLLFFVYIMAIRSEL